MNLNSLLHIPKTQGNFNCAGSFATILLSGLKERGYKIISLKKHSRYEDMLVVSINNQTKSLVIGGEDSVEKILKRLDKIK